MKPAKLFSIIFFLCITAFCKAQDSWGEADIKTFSNRIYPADTSANIIELLAVCDITFGYEDGRPIVIYTIRKRWQVLRKEAFDDIPKEIWYYEPGKIGRIADIEVQTLNLDDKGKIKVSDLDKAEIFDVKLNDWVGAKKFAFPEVKEGSILELSYTLNSKSIRFLRDWDFQEDIPVLYSRVTIHTPPVFHYAEIIDKSNIQIDMKVDSLTESFPKGLFGPAQFDGEKVIIEGSQITFTANNIPALKEESYITTMKDYRAKVLFELASITFPQHEPETFTTNWDEAANELMKIKDFGLQLNETGEHMKLAREMATDIQDTLERLKKIYDIVTSHMKWNGEYSCFPYQTLTSAFENRTANSAAVNMILLDMLRAAKINADPVLLSTRPHGKVQIKYPDVSQFNHVIVAAQIDTQKIFLDATTRLPYNLINDDDLNCTGLRISRNGITWEDIPVQKKSNNTVISTVKMDSSGLITGKVNIISSNYEAHNIRSYLEKKSLEEFLDKEVKKYGAFEISNSKTENQNEMAKKLNIGFDYKEAIDSGSLYYLHPFPVTITTENPFKMKKRDYPVDFAYPFEENCKTSIVMPDNYKISEMPKNMYVSLSDSSATYSFTTETTGNMIQCNSALKINRTEFRPGEYDALKGIYAHMMDAFNAVVVLEKK